MEKKDLYIKLKFSFKHNGDDYAGSRAHLLLPKVHQIRFSLKMIIPKVISNRYTKSELLATRYMKVNTQKATLPNTL